jgi:GT2 family glycosyltransferase
MEEIAFLCVNFNNAIESGRLLDSLARQEKQSAEFAVRCAIVDNSTSERAAAECEGVARRYSWATYVRSPGNLGYFGGLNYGMSAEAISNARYLVICNNDIQFESSFCARLVQNRYPPNIFAICPDVITADGIHQNPHILKRISRFRRLQFDVYFAHFYLSRLLILILKTIRPVKESPQQPEKGCELHMGVGACYVLTPEFLKRFDRLEYPFFLYGEEAYLANQIHSAGGLLWFDPNLRAYHSERASFSQLPNRTAYEFAREGYPDYRRLM